MELKPLAHRRIGITVGRLGEAEIIVSRLDLCEQDGQGLVQVRSVAPGGDVDERELSQTVDAVSRLVVGGSGRHDVELWRCLGAEEEEDSVEEPQRLCGQWLCCRWLKGSEACAAAKVDDLVGEELGRVTECLAEGFRDRLCVLDGVVEDRREPCGAFGTWGESVCAG